MKKKLTGQIKRRCNANENFANSAAPKITVNLFSLKFSSIFVSSLKIGQDKKSVFYFVELRFCKIQVMKL